MCRGTPDHRAGRRARDGRGAGRGSRPQSPPRALPNDCATALVACAGEVTMLEDVHDATDLVDEGLSLVRCWEQRGLTHFRGLAGDLFRFGARVYGGYQPHFLSEFVRENMDPRRSSRDYVES